jgi:rhodanese-related sulfurtransferase
MPPDHTIDALLARARDRLDRVSPKDLVSAMRDGAIVVDVRDTAQRLEQGELPGAHVIDLTILEWRLAPSSDSRSIDLSPNHQVILVCSEGFSSSLAAVRLQELGVPGATDLEGGFKAWSAWNQEQ